jgi:uncharacterized protein DUF6912
VRVYLPATTSMLHELLDNAAIGPVPLTAFAVTPGLREWYLDEDPESLEYAAMVEAARGSLRLIDADEQAARRRVVIAVEAADGDVDVRDDIDRGVVQLGSPVTMSVIVSVHVDDAEAEPTVAAAAEAVIAADLGDPGSQDAIDDAEGFELSWYANQEIPALVALL